MNSQRTVLIVDDELDLCLLLKGFFQRNGYEVSLAHSVANGLDMALHLQPGLIFLDNNLPDGIGWQLAPQLALQLKETQLVLLSAYHPTVPDMPEGANFLVLEKPVSLAELERRFASGRLDLATT